jgi:prepilin-type N-terminal cleavage/methylation domain-containing protein
MNNNKGFTIVELVVVLAILSIIMAISIPNFSAWLPRNRIKTSVRHIYNDMNLAKSRAVKDNTVAVIIFNIPNDTYTIFLDTSKNWALDAGETIISTGGLEDDVDIYLTTFPSNTYGFNNRGMSQPPLTGPYEVYLTNSSGLFMGVRVNMVGNPTIINSTDGGTTWS